MNSINTRACGDSSWGYSIRMFDNLVLMQQINLRHLWTPVNTGRKES